MSVLNQSGEEQVECPLCMEPLEVDDLNFYPCTCGYQICRFCWHRIRTDENGLCPACRKAYSENPADFTPLSKEQVAQLKAEKRQRDQQRKAKLSESRKHLASVRVVQKNLVFVVGLPVRLADADVLKRHEYFGKFGKIHKVVINQSTSYAGSQGPSASAYVTYVKSDDALRAIQNVNNIMLDGRLIKSSLGTTKYCSHFMKNQPCPKPDCMYLHDFGDPEASFTKEQMHLGKHQEYEKKLHDALLNRTAAQQQGGQGGQQPLSGGQATASLNIGGEPRKENGQKQNGQASERSQSQSQSQGGGKEGNSWPTLSGSSASSSSSSTDSGFGSKSEKSQKDSKTEKNNKGNKGNQKNKSNNNNNLNAYTTNASNNNNNNNNIDKKSDRNQVIKQCEQSGCHQQPQPSPHDVNKKLPKDDTSECIENLSKMQLMDDNSSFFSHNTFQKILPDQDSSSYSDSSSVTPHSNILNDNLPDISSSEDWEAAFGFSKKPDSPSLEPADPIGDNFTPQAASYERNDGYIIDNYQQKGQPSFDKRDILDALNRTQFPSSRLEPSTEMFNVKLPEPPNTNGLDQQMSKFFAEFNNQQNKNNGFTQGGGNGYTQEHDQLLLLNQYQQRLAVGRSLEEQAAMLNLKQSLLFGPQQRIGQSFTAHIPSQVQHVHSPQTFINGTDHFMGQNGHNSFQNNGPGFTHNSVFQNQSLQRQALRGERSNVDDDLGFDPFHETQKALAELIESEQTVSQLQNSALLNPNLSGHTSNGAPPNGLQLHGSNTGYYPPPPPGFLQHNTHMNSFGSKILPFLNMSNSQQISSPGGWTNNYSEAQLKGLAPVNDWTTLDPAIVSSSRHFPLVNLPVREQYRSPFQQQVQQASASQLQAYSDYQTSTFNYSSHNVQQNCQNGGYAHLAQPNGLNWYGSELQSQISSPPGFRQAGVVAQTKSQEC